MKLNKYLKRIIYWGHLSVNKVNHYQKIIRDNEWDSIQNYIKPNVKFLDVGCGSGYAMQKAKTTKNCEVYGIDPKPNKHGVKFLNNEINIKEGIAENIPFQNSEFDIVYSSHVIEHVENISKSLSEFNRVLKPDGIAILIVPTSSSAWINLISSVLFTTHLRILRYLARPITKSKRTRLKHVFFPYSHGVEEKTVFFDIKQYQISAWKKQLESHFKIKEIILPFFYPFPDYIQLFKAHKNKRFGSSVAFICEKKRT
jgi:ubiquinone/menaquinone biosynthesis C-methylase UbiE